VIDKAKRIAAVMLEVPATDIAFNEGLFVAPNSNRRLTLFDVACGIDDHPDLPEDMRELRAEATFTGRIPAYPTGAAVCEAEVDPETGVIEVRRYTSIDDGGQAINPLILHGQVHGGVAQGVGQAMLEATVYEPGSGSCCPRAFSTTACRAPIIFRPWTLSSRKIRPRIRPSAMRCASRAAVRPASRRARRC
jgi:carbon-monoxide dehydrogenase large subunit